MGDWAQQVQENSRVTISSASLESIGLELITSGAGAASATWPAANRAIYVPFLVYTPLTVVKMFTINGATASGNIDIGIYDGQQNRIVSKGSTAQSGTSAIQEFDITDTTLQIGTYYMGLSMDGTTGTFLRSNPTVGFLSACGVLSQSLGSVTLPDPATFAAAQDAYVPFFGLTARTVV